MIRIRSEVDLAGLELNPRLKLVSEYIRTIEEKLAAGVAAEGTHYPALQKLLEQLKPDVKTNLLPHRS